MEEFAVIPVITGVVQALKMAFLPSKFAGVLSIVLGVLFACGINHGVTVESVVMGVVFGLSSAGTYDITKMGINKTRSIIGK